ncbi:MAG: hypothetical protein Q4F13_02110 [Pseudomonadota bacterium]|nr:hypothetical protein [Pseudomonadota bacterium]
MQGELQTDIKHEDLAGQVLAMDGASDRHGLIAGELFALLRSHARLQADLYQRNDDVTWVHLRLNRPETTCWLLHYLSAQLDLREVYVNAREMRRS